MVINVCVDNSSAYNQYFANSLCSCKNYRYERVVQVGKSERL